MLQQHDETDTPKWNESGVPHFFSAETKFWWTYTKCHSAFGGTDRLDRAEPSVRGSSGVLRIYYCEDEDTLAEESYYIPRVDKF